MALQLGLRRGLTSSITRATTMSHHRYNAPVFVYGGSGSSSHVLPSRFKSTDVGDVIVIDLGTTNSCVAIMVSCLSIVHFLVSRQRGRGMKGISIFDKTIVFLALDGMRISIRKRRFNHPFYRRRKIQIAGRTQRASHRKLRGRANDAVRRCH